MKNDTVTTEDWLEKIFHLLQTNMKKESKPRRAALEDLGMTDSAGVCHILGVSLRTVAEMRKSGEIRFTKKGNRYYYLLQDIKDMLSEGFARK